MNLSKKITSLFLSVVLLFGMVFQIVFAEGNEISPLKYEISQEVSEDGTAAVISLHFGEMESLTLEKIKFPDGSEQMENFSSVSYNVSENGTYPFTVYYTLDGNSKEELVQAEVKGLKEPVIDEIVPDASAENNEEQPHDAVQQNETEPVSEDPVIDSAAKTVTYNNDINIEIKDQTAEGVNDRIAALNTTDGKRKNYTYTYNGAVNITVANCSLNTLSLVKGCDFSIWNRWVFNGPVTLTIKNSTISRFASMFHSGTFSADGNEEEQSFFMNDRLTVNVDHSTIGTLIGGMQKITSPSFPPVPSREFNGVLDGGVQFNISDQSKITTLIGGHYFGGNDNPLNETHMASIFRVRGVDVIIDNSEVESVLSARSKVDVDRNEAAKINGDFSVTLRNGGTVSQFFANGAMFSSGKEHAGDVTGTASLNTSSETAIKKLAGCEKVNLADKLTVTESLVLPNGGMKIGLINADVWKGGSTVLSYNYTTESFPPVDSNMVTPAWTGDEMSLEYSLLADHDRQEWKLAKNTATVTFESNCDIVLPPVVVKIGDLVAAPSVSRDGYTLEGWYRDNNFTKRWNPDEHEAGKQTNKWNFDTDRVGGDMTLYAKWTQEQNLMRVRFETNGGTPINDAFIPYGQAMTMPISIKAGYTLESWYTDKDFKTRWNFADPVRSDMTLYANWSVIHGSLPEYSAGYTFICGTADRLLPKEVMDLLPIDNKKYRWGTTITAIQLTKTTVAVKDGVWNFKGYDANEKVAVSDVIFSGTWEFTKTSQEKPEKPDDNQNPGKPENPGDNAKPDNNGDGLETLKPEIEQTTADAPRTGDDTSVTLYAALAAVSAGLLIAFSGHRSRRRQKNK